MDRGKVIWFTGPNNSGKTTLARLLHCSLKAVQAKAELLDDENVKRHFPELNEIAPNAGTKLIGHTAKLLSRNGVWVVVAATSSVREDRETVKREIPEFIEVYCKRNSDDKNYQEPKNPDILLDTHKQTEIQSFRQVMSYLRREGRAF